MGVLTLIEAARLEGLEVVRDHPFESLGTVIHTLPNMLVFVEDRKYVRGLGQNASICCVITTGDLAEAIDPRYGVAISANPRESFYRLHNRLARETDFYWQDFPSSIDATASIHPSAVVAPRNVRIGPRVVIEPHVTVLERVDIDDDSILRAGCVIGAQGFEHKRIHGRILPVEHAGAVRIGKRVEIQANSTVDRSVFGGATRLGDDTKLDNMVQVAHNVTVGERCLLAACAMIAGSVTMGDDVWIGPNATITSGITIGTGASITLGSVVTRDVPAGVQVTGNWAVPHDTFLAGFRRSLRATD